MNETQTTGSPTKGQTTQVKRQMVKSATKGETT